MTSGGLIRLAVTAPPADGEANEAATALLAKLLAVPKRAVRLVTGEKSRDKTFAIDGIDLEVAMGRIREGS